MIVAVLLTSCTQFETPNENDNKVICAHSADRNELNLENLVGDWRSSLIKTSGIKSSLIKLDLENDQTCFYGFSYSTENDGQYVGGRGTYTLDNGQIVIKDNEGENLIIYKVNTFSYSEMSLTVSECSERIPEVFRSGTLNYDRDEGEDDV